MLDTENRGEIELGQLRWVMIEMLGDASGGGGGGGGGGGRGGKSKMDVKKRTKEQERAEREKNVDAMLEVMWPEMGNSSLKLARGAGLSKSDWLSQRISFRQFVEFIYR